MIYDYSPNTYNDNLIKQLNLEELFVQLQIKYKSSLEKFLMKYVKFDSLDELIKKKILFIPEKKDISHNFYLENSTLNSKYLFLRNNIHIENLTKKDIQYIKSCLFDKKYLDDEFILKTIKDVIFEQGDTVFYGIPIEKNEVNSKSLVFEFVYDDKLCTVTESKQIREFYNNISSSLKSFLEESLNIEVNFILNDGF